MTLPEKKEGADFGAAPFQEKGNIETARSYSSHCLEVNVETAGNFLSSVCEDSLICFQSFNDDIQKKSAPKHGGSSFLAKTFHGHFNDCKDDLRVLNSQGACVCFAVNETDGKGRAKKNITRIRAVFVDLDGAPLQRIYSSPLAPHIIVESSPGKYHCYWLVEDFPIDRFSDSQRRLAEIFGGDKACTDLSRCMRIPGFIHAKDPSRPFVSRVLENSGERRYTASEIFDAFRIDPSVHLRSEKSKELVDLSKSEMPDPLLRELEKRGLVKKRIDGREGTWDITCPWVKSHTKAVDSGTAYFQKGNGYDGEAFKCLHAHCAEKTILHLKEFLGIEDLWPEPRPFEEELLPVSKFDPEFLVPSLRAYVTDCAERIGCPTDFVAIGIMVVFSSIIGAGCCIRPHAIDDWTVISNLWGAVVGPPSVKKSPALNAGMLPLGFLEKEAGAEFVKNKAKLEIETVEIELRKKKLKKALESAIEEENENVIELCKSKLIFLENELSGATHKRYKTNNTTTEKLQEMLAENPRGILQFNDEIIGFLANLDKVGREDSRAFYLEGWNGWSPTEYQTDRIVRGTTSCNPCISILGGIQPSKLRMYLKEVLSSIGNDGFTQRFQLLVYPDIPNSIQLVDRAPDREACEKIIEIARKLATTSFFGLGAQTEGEFPLPVFRFQPEAQDYFHAWLVQNNKRTLEMGDDLLAQHLAKYPKLIPSLSLINSLVRVASGDPNHGVSLDDVSRAVRFSEYLETHARRMYSMIDRRGIHSAKILLSKIRDGELKDDFTKRDVHRPKWSGITTPEEAQEALDELVERGCLREIEIDSTPHGGRPTTKYRIHPKLKEARKSPTAKTDET